MTKVWITRTLPAADESASNWGEAGFEPILAPLLKIEAVAHEPLPKTETLIFTSKNAIDHIVCAGQRAICVGDATAEKARTAGYSNVISVDGTSTDITAWVKDTLQKTEPLCHVSGWHVRGRIAEDLQSLGYSARRVKVYRSVPRPVWPSEAFSMVAFYSPLAAKTFAELAKTRDVTELEAICISEATAKELGDLYLKSKYFPARPREDELIMAAKNAERQTLAVKG